MFYLFSPLDTSCHITTTSTFLESHKRIYNVIDNVRMHSNVMISTLDLGLPKPGGGRWCSILSNFFNQRSQVQNKRPMMKMNNKEQQSVVNISMIHLSSRTIAVLY